MVSDNDYNAALAGWFSRSPDPVDDGAMFGVKKGPEHAAATRRPLCVRGLTSRSKLGFQLRQRHPRRQLFGIQIGRDDPERVVVRRTRRRAGAGIIGHALRALAADIFVRGLADLAL